MNRRIELATTVLDRAKESLKRVALNVQSTCAHKHVAELPWRPGKWLGPSNARRLCTNCGLEEEGSHWSGEHVWSRVDFKAANLGNEKGRIVAKVDDPQEFYNLRVPGLPVNCNPREKTC